MGVKNLWDIIESCKKTLPLHHLQNKRVCIDLSCWIVQLHKVNKSRISIQDKFYLRGLFHRLRALIALNCTIVFVTDGSIPAIKLSTYRQRLNSGIEVTSDELSSHDTDTSSCRRNMGSQFSCMIKEAKILGSALGITCLDGIEEAEAQCALLNSESLCDGCFTSDSDAFLFGARTVYRDICLGEGGYVVCYEMTDIERTLGFGRKSLIALALLLGGDYSQGVRGLGPESACQIVKSSGENNVLQQIVKEGISFAKKTKASKKQTRLKSSDPESNINGTDKHLQKQNQNQFLQVIDAYLRPKCHSAESEPVYRALAALPLQRAQLQQVCSQFFGWTPEKTDEYILPKIAERDLRRFASLRLTSSELGVNPPLQKIPIRCPVSCIVKPRKVQGKECFEVQWEGLEGLETSIVPADLVDSACPEKITEFVEKRVLGKKQKNRRKPGREKSENIASVTEVELRLQELLLDIESDSNTALTYSLPSKASTSKDATAVVVNDSKQGPPFARPQTDLDCGVASSFHDVGSSLLLHIESDSNTAFTYSLPSKASTSKDTTAVVADDRKQEPPFARPQTDLDFHAASSFSDAAPSLVKNEIIDLLSPSPAPRIRMVSRCQQTSCQQIDVIDLSDSETEVSPEHAQKAREFRSFLASIRDE